MINDLPPLMSAWFVVTGMKFHPNDCTAHFGVEPTEASREGEARLGKRPTVRYSSWRLKTKKTRLRHTDEALQLLLNLIWPKRRQIMNFVKENDLKITITLCLTGHSKRNFLYDFSPRTLTQLSFFKAPLTLDIC
jgi:hypothetical protein